MRVINYRPVEITKTIYEDCPLCGQSKIYNITFCSYGVEGYRVIKFRRSIFGRLYKITKERFECHTCGAKWKNETIKERIYEGKINDTRRIQSDIIKEEN